MVPQARPADAGVADDDEDEDVMGMGDDRNTRPKSWERLEYFCGEVGTEIVSMPRSRLGQALEFMGDRLDATMTADFDDKGRAAMMWLSTKVELNLAVSESRRDTL